MPTLKFKFDDSIKRVNIDEIPVSFAGCVRKVKESFSILSVVNESSFNFVWQDCDGDKCTCQTNEEIQDAILELEKISKPLIFEVKIIPVSLLCFI